MLILTTDMSVQQPQFYNQLTAMLGPEEQQVIKDALMTAEKIQQQQQIAGAAEGTPVQTNGNS